MRKALLFAFVPWILSAQPVSFGVKAGVPVTDPLQTARQLISVGCSLPTSYFVTNNAFLVGGTVQINLPRRFSLEIDGLY